MEIAQENSHSLKTWISLPINQLICLLSLIPVVFIAFYIYHNAVSVPIYEQWAISADLAIKTQTDELEFQDLLKQRAEHRVFFTNVVTVIMAYTTHWDAKLETWVTFILACANLGMLAKLFFKDEPRGLVWVLIPFALLVFSVRQRTGWLSGFLNCWHFCIFFLLLSLYTLKHANVGWKPLALSAFWVFCAMYALGSGLPIWILLIPTLWMLNYRKWRYYFLWVGMASLSYVIYFADYDFGSNSVPIALPDVIRFFLEYLGSSFIGLDLGMRQTAQWIGALGIGLFLLNAGYLIYHKTEWSKLAVWVTLALFVLGTDFGTSLRRSGSSQIIISLSDRYIIVSMLFWVSIVALGTMSCRHILQNSGAKYSKVLFVNGNLFCLVLLLGYYLNANYQTAILPAVVTPENTACFVAYPVTQDSTCLRGLHAGFRDSPPKARERQLLQDLLTLADYRLAIFSDTKPGSIMLPYHYGNFAQEALQRENTRLALEFYRQGLALYPDDVKLYIGRGELYVEMGRPQQALNNFNQALRREPNNITALNARGALLMAQGESQQARADFERVLMIDPTNAFAQAQLQGQ